MALPLEESVFVDLGLNLRGEIFVRGTQGSEKCIIGRVIRFRVHRAVWFAALEIGADVVIGCVGVGVGQGMVVAPEFAPCINAELFLTGFPGLEWGVSAKRSLW